MPRQSHLDEFTHLPGAIITNLAIWVPLFGVTQMSLSESYRLPPVGSQGYRSLVPVSDDSVTITALLVGPQRHFWKAELELLADLSKRVDVLDEISSGGLGGLALITTLAIRIDMQIDSLSFSVDAQRTDTISTSIGLRHVPQPRVIDPLLDVATVGVAMAADFA